MRTRFNLAALIKRLTELNRLAREHGFVYMDVSDLEGFSDALESMQDPRPLVCVSDTSAGGISLDNTPSTRCIRTVFMFYPHPIAENYEGHRQRAFEVMRELFRQLLTVIIRQSTKLSMEGLYLDRTVSFEEIDRYFFSGGACAYYNIAIDRYTDLQLRDDEWIENPMLPESRMLGENLPKRSTGQ